MANGPDGVTVKIFGQDYTLRGQDGAADLAALARVVDERMREAATARGDASPLQLAVLAALNLADDLHREQDRRLSLDVRVRRATVLLAEEIGKAPADGVS